MIVDSHVHAFPPMGEPAGHRTTRDHMRYLQHLILFHHMAMRRMDNSSLHDGPNLLYDGREMSINGLTDVDFRGHRNGKFAWTADGVDYDFQYLPTNLANLNAPPELMVA